MEFEEWVLQAMLGIEEAAKRRNGINAITTGICWNQVVCKRMARSQRILLKNY